MENIENLSESFGIRISSVLITEEEGGGDGLQQLAGRSGGASYRVARTGPTLAMYSDLVEAMRNLIAVDTKVNSICRVGQLDFAIDQSHSSVHIL